MKNYDYHRPAEKVLLDSYRKQNRNKNRLLFLAVALTVGVIFCIVSFAYGKIQVYIQKHIRTDGMTGSTYIENGTEEMAGQFANVFLTKIRQAVKEFQPDLILSHHLYLLTALVREHFPELPVYGFCHNTDLRQLQKNVLKQEYIKAQIAKLNRIFALHEEQKTQICQMFHVTAEQVEVSGMGYNSHIFRDLHIRKVPGKTKIVFAGKISEKKGVESLIRSLAYLPYEADKLEVYLAGGAGNETEYARICRLAEKAPYPVHFLGKLEQMELAKVYNTCDIFALPSFSEGLPLTVIEALACGDRVVMSDHPGIREWLDTYAPGADIR